MIWAVLSFGGVSAVLGWLLLRCKKHSGRLKAENVQLQKMVERLKVQISTGKPSDDDVLDRLRKADGGI